MTHRIHWSLISGVHRRKDTRQASMASFHAAGIEAITVHLDNGTFGPMGNMDRALRHAIEAGGDHVCVLQDDMLLARDTLLAIDQPMGNGYALVLFTPEQNVPHELRDRSGWVKLEPSWYTWGGMVLMPMDVAIEVVKHPFWLRHLHTMPERRQSDAATFETLRLLGVQCLQHVPSLSDHIGGDSSTIGNSHDEATRGFRFTEWG